MTRSEEREEKRKLQRKSLTCMWNCGGGGIGGGITYIGIMP